MADAKKCDICGKFYEKYTTKSSFSDKEVDGFRFGIDGNTTRHSYWDCCPECLTSIENYIKSLRGEVKKPVDDKACFTCKYFKEEPDSDYCIGCPTPENAHSKWVAKEETKPLMATALTINPEDYTVIATLEDHWRGPLNDRIIPGEIRDHYTCTIGGVEREVVLSPKVIEDLKKWR